MNSPSLEGKHMQIVLVTDHTLVLSSSQFKGETAHDYH